MKGSTELEKPSDAFEWDQKDAVVEIFDDLGYTIDNNNIIDDILSLSQKFGIHLTKIADKYNAFSRLSKINTERFKEFKDQFEIQHNREIEQQPDGSDVILGHEDSE